MIMEFIFSEQKAIENNYDIEKCYGIVDRYFAKHDIKKIGEGVYQAPDTQQAYSAFGGAVWDFPDTSWFLKVIDEWYWRAESDDIEDREDCLKAYYEVQSVNKK